MKIREDKPMSQILKKIWCHDSKEEFEECFVPPEEFCTPNNFCLPTAEIKGLRDWSSDLGWYFGVFFRNIFFCSTASILCCPAWTCGFSRSFFVYKCSLDEPDPMCPEVFYVPAEHVSKVGGGFGSMVGSAVGAVVPGCCDYKSTTCYYTNFYCKKVLPTQRPRISPAPEQQAMRY